MDSVRSPSSITFCLCIHFFICLLAVSASTSLWGKKLKFSPKPKQTCWLHRVAVPPLEELTVCVLLQRTSPVTWTGFAYKAPREYQTELGLKGDNNQLNAYLFGKQYDVTMELTLNQWHSVCLTWSRLSQTLHLYVNGTCHLTVSVDPTTHQRLAQNGTLTLGQTHFVEADGTLQTENDDSLFGEIGRFRMWGREWTATELQAENCADGDVVNWDLQHWENTYSVEPDSQLNCAWPVYKITIRWLMENSSEHVNITPKAVMRNWMENVFPKNISVHDIILSPCNVYDVANRPLEERMEKKQASRRRMISTFVLCFTGDVFASVEPAVDVQLVQALIADKLSLPFPLTLPVLMADNRTLRILPVEYLSIETKPPPGTDTPIPISTHDSSPNTATTSTSLHDHEDNSTSAFRPDTFFRANVNLNMMGTSANPKDIIAQWLNEKLKINRTMDVLNLKIQRSMKQDYSVLTSSKTERYECTFHIQAFMATNVDATEKLIHETLTTKYENGGVVIETMNVMIKHIEPGTCPSDTTRTIYGVYMWPESFPQERPEILCVQSDAPGKRGHRLCSLEADVDTARWAEPKLEECKPLITISDLGRINVTTANAADVLAIIQELVTVQTGNASVSDGNLSPSQLETVVDKLGDIIDVSTVTPTLGTDVINVISDILCSKSDITPVANMVLTLTETIGDRMDFPEDSLEVSYPSIAFSMINAEPDTFSGLTFGVMSSFLPGLSPTTFVNQSFETGPLPATVASISLPSALQNFFPFGDNRTRLQFQFYGTQDLFKDAGPSTAENNWTLNTYVVSASVNGSHAIYLTEQRVVVTLNLQMPAEANDKVQCVFWDFQKNGGQGGWNSSGCETHYISPYQTSCHCDHLTHFGVLLDVSRTPIGKEDVQILTVISNLGCGLSSFFLSITLLTYIAFDKLRKDYPSKILLNLSAALLGLNMVYLLNSWLASFWDYGLCVVTAASLHFFLLASFTWMGLEAMHMYLALVKVFNVYVRSYILKFCVLGWGIPLVVVSAVLAINMDAYGDISLQQPQGREAALWSSDDAPFCWLQSPLFLYVSVLPLVGLVLLCNTLMFAVVLVQLRRMRAQSKQAGGGGGGGRGSLQDLKAAASLTVLLGLTWPLIFFAWGPARVPLLYVFAVLNTLQGFFIFMFHCLMKEKVRKQWRIHLCCGRFRLSEYSDWSRSRSKEKHLVHSACMPSVNSNKNVSDSSASNHHQRA